MLSSYSGELSGNVSFLLYKGYGSSVRQMPASMAKPDVTKQIQPSCRGCDEEKRVAESERMQVERKVAE